MFILYILLYEQKGKKCQTKNNNVKNSCSVTLHTTILSIVIGKFYDLYIFKYFEMGFLNYGVSCLSLDKRKLGNLSSKSL